MYDYPQIARNICAQNFYKFATLANENVEKAFCALFAEYIEANWESLSELYPVENNPSDFNEDGLFDHVFDLFRWFNREEASEYYGLNPDGSGFWYYAEEYLADYQVYYYLDYAGIIAWLDV